MEYVEASQGKGIYIRHPENRETKRVLVLFDKLSTYKEITFNTMTAKIGKQAKITILLHNQSVELLKYYLDENLDKYDYYVISPHFPLDRETHRQVVKQLIMVPFRKLIMIDHWVNEIQGAYGVAYQDYDNNISECLEKVKEEIKAFRQMNVITLPSSLYHEAISQSVLRFCKKNNIQVTFHSKVSKEMLHPQELYLLLNGQLDSELNELAKLSNKKNLQIGKDIGIISYNESPINELVLGGLTTVSVDFAQMGKLAAQMIVQDTMKKVKCDFKLIRRATF